MESIDTKVSVRDWLLFALTFSSGAVDAISYFGLKIFSAFMTGNLVFLGFGIADSVGPPVLPADPPPLLGVILRDMCLRRGGLCRGADYWAFFQTIGCVALAGVGGANSHGGRRSCISRHLDSNGGTTIQWNYQCPSHPDGAGHGASDLRGSIARRAGRVDYGCDLHVDNLRSRFRRFSSGRRAAATGQRARQLDRRLPGGRTAFPARVNLRPCIATRDHNPCGAGLIIHSA